MHRSYQELQKCVDLIKALADATPVVYEIMHPNNQITNGYGVLVGKHGTDVEFNSRKDGRLVVSMLWIRSLTVGGVAMIRNWEVVA